MVRYGAPLAAAERAVVLVHGRGGTPETMRELVVDRLGLDDRVCFIAPAAPDQTWYPCGFMAPRDDNEPHLTRALGCLAATVDELGRADFGPARIVFVGFSQGACLCTEFVARHAAAWGGLAALTGGLIGAPEEVGPLVGERTGMATYFGTSDVDDWVPLARVEATVARFRAAGADVRFDVFSGMGHDVCDEEIDVVRDLIAGPR